MLCRIFVDPSNGSTYDELCASAKMAEELGFNGVFLSDHLTSFVDSAGPGPTDVWTTLAALARETTTIRLGSLVSSVMFRHPGLLAMTVAQIDAMSGGRVEFGYGAGYFEGEHRALGVPFPDAAERFNRLEEALEVITGLWRTPVGEKFSFAGEHYALVEALGLPKPQQPNGPPIILGGTGKRRTPQLAGRFADEFNLQTSRRRAPTAVSELHADDVGPQIERVCSEALAQGRDRDSVVFSMSALVGVGRTAGAARAAIDPEHYGGQTFDGAVFSGSPAQIVDALGTWAQKGIKRVYVRAPNRMAALASNFELFATDVLPELARL